MREVLDSNAKCEGRLIQSIHKRQVRIRIEKRETKAKHARLTSNASILLAIEIFARILKNGNGCIQALDGIAKLGVGPVRFECVLQRERVTGNVMLGHVEFCDVQVRRSLTVEEVIALVITLNIKVLALVSIAFKSGKREVGFTGTLFGRLDTINRFPVCCRGIRELKIILADMDTGVVGEVRGRVHNSQHPSTIRGISLAVFVAVVEGQTRNGVGSASRNFIRDVSI